VRLGVSQNKQLPSGALNTSSNREAQRALRLSLVNPMAGSWSLMAYPKSIGRVSSVEKLLAFRRTPSAGAEAETGASMILCRSAPKDKKKAVESDIKFFTASPPMRL